MNNINIYFIRHGETAINKKNDEIGQAPNEPLTTNGVNQAGRLGKRFLDDKIEFDRIYSSTYKRAMTTAEIFSKVVGYKGSIGLSSDLREYSAGDWVGKKREEIYSDRANSEKMLNLNMGFKFPGENGESYKQVERRAAKWLEDEVIYNEDVLKMAEERPLNIGIVSHGQVSKCLLFYILGFDQSFLWRISLDNTGVCHLVYNPERGWFLKTINDTKHLYF